MLSPANIRANVLVKLGELTGKTHALPLVLFSPTARCNSRCISCDWWRSDGAGDLSLAEIETLAGDLERAGTGVVVLTGGEPLVRPDVMAVADLFRARGMALQLLTSGLALGRYADDVAARFQTVTVSLDGHTPELYRAIRGVDGLGAVADGVRKLRARAPHVGITARATIHRHNFRFLPDLVAKSRAMGLEADLVPGGQRRCQLGGVQSPGGVAAGVGRRWVTGPAAAERRGGRGIRGDRRDGDPPLPRGARRAAHRPGSGRAAPPGRAITARTWDRGRSSRRPVTRRGPACSSRRTVPSGRASSIPRSATCASAPSRNCCRTRCRRFAPAWTWRRTRCARAASAR